MGCADVCLSMLYEGSNEFYAEKIVTARKATLCSECGDVIAVGDQYERSTGKSDGAIFTERTCLPCREIRNAFCCGSWIFGKLWEAIADEMFPVWRKAGSWDCLAKLDTEAARTKLQKRYDEWHDEWRADHPEAGGTA